MLGHCPDAMLPAEIGDHSHFGYWRVDDVDAFHAESYNEGQSSYSRPPIGHGVRARWQSEPRKGIGL
jgi:hypothetical protein